MVKAIFFDVDGTLVSFKTHRMPVSALRALRQLREKDIKLFVATGRNSRELSPLDEFDFDGYVTMNGNYCLDAAKRVIFKRHIPSADMERLICRQQGDKPFACILEQEHGTCINFVNDRVRELAGLVKVNTPPVLPFGEWCDFARGGVLQMLGFFSPEDEADVMSRVLTGCDTMRWNPLFTDIIPKGSSKQGGVDMMLEHAGISLADTLAFGDGGNDVGMLRHVATGVAMGNAADPVKAASDFVTASVDEDGIWKGLLHFGLVSAD